MSEEPISINSKDEYESAKNALNKQSLPHAILRVMMRAVEAYRSKRRYGWSRPWNKYNLVNFQSFRLKPARDQQWVNLARAVLAKHAESISPQDAEYIDDLLKDKNLMGFIFIHEYEPKGEMWEGATLSFGRIVEKKFRDRLDLIVEAPVENDMVSTPSRIRIYIDPFNPSEEISPQNVIIEDRGLNEEESKLFRELANVSWDWKDSAEHIWDHWTSHYIDYFGKRNFKLSSSHFFSENKSERIEEVPSSIDEAV
ncbi:MAG: hypothetical protein OEX00_07820 [Gammaproteobacteria bacterium]|nr:hypothetical protein [Gammaproteobacteria bacterium]MDH5693459.1 hypothetical protein [Gammaproteobacteria bacterium]